LTEEAVLKGKIRYFGSNVSSFKDMGEMEKAIEPVLRRERLLRPGADDSLVAAARIPLALDKQKGAPGKETGQSGEASFWLAYFVNIIMYVAVLMYGIQVSMAVVEEKSNRIVEVLVSSLSPFELLIGKVVGVASVGVLQLAIWGGAGFYL